VHTAPRGIGFYLVARQSELQREAFARAAGFCACRIMALTGWGQEIDRTRSREAGFDHHLVKPVDPRNSCACCLRVEPGGSKQG
jgi:CheY-like chemotaxis protein